MSAKFIDDPNFRVEILAKTQRPNLLCYLAMHQDYSEGAVIDEWEKLSELTEDELGERIVRRCIKYHHWGILEHPSMTLNVVGFPHSVMVQARTHRVGVSFDCQSQRYTGERVLKLANLFNANNHSPEQAITLDNLHHFQAEIEKIFYFRPVGNYRDREGNRYQYSNEQRCMDMVTIGAIALEFRNRITKSGFAPEHARDLLSQNIRQNFVVTFNARSLLHFCDLRYPADAQLEIRTLADRLFAQFQTWMPEVAEWYSKNRLGKNKLAP